MDVYAEEILDHYRHPRNKADSGSVKESAVVHTEKNPACGDEILLGLTVENEVIKSIKWEGEGCAISQAAMSMFSQELLGKTLNETEALTPKDVLNLLKVPISKRRIKCALLCLHTIHNALRKNRSERSLSWAETVGNAGDPS
jgi:nitrogen fixation protein NifU and related proteins